MPPFLNPNKPNNLINLMIPNNFIIKIDKLCKFNKQNPKSIHQNTANQPIINIGNK